MNASTKKITPAYSPKRGLITALVLLVVVSAYGAWDFNRQYEVESDVAGQDKNKTGAMAVIFVKNASGSNHLSDEDLLAKALTDRLGKRGYSIQLLEVEDRQDGVDSEDASRPDSSSESMVALVPQVLSDTGQQSTVLLVYVESLRIKRRSRARVSITYALKLLNSDQSVAWDAKLTYNETLIEPLVTIAKLSSGKTPDQYWEVLADRAIEQMSKDGMLHSPAQVKQTRK